jgi:NADPH2:quinone reductase
MKAIVIPEFGGPEVLQIRNVSAPEPSDQEILVRVQAAGVNFADILTASGGYPRTTPPPLVAGREFCGVVEGTVEDPRETGHARVMGYTQWGAFAEFVAARRNYFWSVPAHWSSEEAAAFPVNYFTAYLAYWKAGLTGDSPEYPGGSSPVRLSNASKPRVLIHAVAGGVGTAAVQIGKLLGIEMYGTSSSEEKLLRVKELGLHYGINYKEHDYEEAVKEMTGGEGVDAVFEMLGGEHTGKSVRCLREFGRVIVYGSATGKAGTLDPRLLYAKGTSVHGLWLSVLSANQKVMEAAWAHMSEWIATDQLRPIVGHVLPMNQAGEAFKLLLERRNFGKVVLTIP